jgi:hypothetical protein
MTVAFLGEVLQSSACTGDVFMAGAQGPFGAAVEGASVVGGPDGHRRPATETTLVMWRSLDAFGIHGGGREGGECICGDVFVLAWSSLAVGMVDGCGRPQWWRLLSFLFEV